MSQKIDYILSLKTVFEGRLLKSSSLPFSGFSIFQIHFHMYSCTLYEQLYLKPFYSYFGTMPLNVYCDTFDDLYINFNFSKAHNYFCEGQWWVLDEALRPWQLIRPGIRLATTPAWRVGVTPRLNVSPFPSFGGSRDLGIGNTMTTTARNSGLSAAVDRNPGQNAFLGQEVKPFTYYRVFRLVPENSGLTGTTVHWPPRSDQRRLVHNTIKPLLK